MTVSKKEKKVHSSVHLVFAIWYVFVIFLDGQSTICILAPCPGVQMLFEVRGNTEKMYGSRS